MQHEVARRQFFVAGAAALSTAALGLSASSAAAQDAASTGKIKIIAINGSPRRDKTTAEALKNALEAAKAVAPDKIDVELVNLVDYNLFASERLFGDAAVKGGDEYAKLNEKLADPVVRGVIVGSPTHNGAPSALIAALFGQIDHSVLQGKIAGALAVGGARNGGQEQVVDGINTYLFHEGAILPGPGGSGRTGALLWNQKDTVAQDEFGLTMARGLAQRVAKLALVVPADALK
jgi:multimeric flavodoxin WrbA